MHIVLKSRPQYPSTKSNTDMNKTKLQFEISESKSQNWMYFYEMWGGWNSKTSRFKKIGLQTGASNELPHPEAYVRHVLDSLAAAIEADKLDIEKFPNSAFESEQVLRDFIGHLRERFLEEWVNERHFYALSKIYNAEQVRTYEALADAMEEEIEEV